MNVMNAVNADCTFEKQGWAFAYRILERIACCLPKKWANERFAQKVSDSLKKWAIRPFAHFSQKEWANLLLFKKLFKNCKNVQKIRIFRFFERIAHFLWVKVKNDRFAQKPSNSLTVVQLSWATWANPLHSLICSKRFEQMSKWAMSKWENSQPCQKAHFVTNKCSMKSQLRDFLRCFSEMIQLRHNSMHKSSDVFGPIQRSQYPHLAKTIAPY